MNILYSFRTRGVGAESVHISGISRALERLGHRVYFQSPCKVQHGADPFKRGNGKEFFWNILSRRMPRLLFEMGEICYNLFSWFRVRRQLRTRDFDLIYERHAFFHFSTGLIARDCAIPLIVEVNELVGDDRVRSPPVLSGLARWCDKRLFDRASLIVVVSPYLKREIMKRHDIACNKIEVHCNGVDEEIARRHSEQKTVVGADPDACCVLGFVGWFVEWHRLDLLIDVFASLCNESPDLNSKLLLVGDGPLRPQLVSQCRELGISDKVIFAGVVEHCRVPEVLRGIDIAVIPHSNQYRSPVKLFEYMIEECAVVAAQTEPISMVIDNGRNGLLFRPLDKADMLHAFMQLVSDVNLRVAMGFQARKDVIAGYTWKHNVQRIMAKLQELGG